MGLLLWRHTCNHCRYSDSLLHGMVGGASLGSVYEHVRETFKPEKSLPARPGQGRVSGGGGQF